MLGGSKNIEALVPMLAGRTREQSLLCTEVALSHPKTRASHQPAARLEGQRLALGPKAGRGFLQTSHSRNRLEVETGSRSRTPVSMQDPTTPSHAKISAASYKINSSGG